MEPSRAHITLEPMSDFEKLGIFYLGRPYDVAQRQSLPGLLLYDSRDLVTHAVCLGMTGSGKTGLCVVLLEEAAIDGVPAIVIDPKGDLGNLLLTFPDLRPSDFRPWIDEEEARNQGITPDEFAARQADRWREGLAAWGQDGARIRRLREAAAFALYTPGSNAGLPVSIMKSFAAPPPAVAADREAMRERVSSTATSLLGLLGIEAKPLESREHALLSTLFDTAWSEGRSLDLAALIGQIQTPPFTRLGVMDLDSFYPPKERFALAMQLNNLLASPGFEAWLEGEPLDVAQFLYTPEGKPRVSIFSIAHLSDGERMFFVSLLLNQVLAWMRAQPGASSLRAILYMDEIFGYFPPVANPPSKTPLLTLLKQARAFGLGVVLATQNPVDLDYKGLANAGTWFIGRLQTERDKLRVLEGLEGAAAAAGGAFDRDRLDRLLAALSTRVFLMNNVHEREPAVFETRWALSYLRGPLTRAQIRSLAPRAESATPPPPPATAVPMAEAARPVAPPDIPQYFAPASPGAIYQPHIAGAAQLHFADARRGVNETREVLYFTPVSSEPVPVDWNAAVASDLTPNDLEPEPQAGARFTPLPPAALKPRQYAAWGKAFAAWLYQTQKVEILRSPSTGLRSAVSEPERDFRIRLQQQARDARDAALAKLRNRYAARVAALEDRLRRAEQAIDREQQQASDQRLGAALSAGSGLLGALFGRKSILTQGAAAARGMSRARREAADVERAAENAAAIRQQLADLEARIESDAAALETRADPATEELERIEIRLRKTGIQVSFVALVWKA
jgi:hypothetical protein